MAGARAADARIVGKTNLTELAMTPIGVNPWFGTPVNPLAPDRIPGGSSSGSAAAVGAGEADVAYGTDTGGSVRIPAACCGLAGLKTTFGRIPVEGVWPLGASLDTVGPLARDLAGIELGMALLEPGFAGATTPATTVGRIPSFGDPLVEAAIDARPASGRLRGGGGRAARDGAGSTTPSSRSIFAELWAADHELLETDPAGLGAEVTELLTLAPAFSPGAAEARAAADPSRRRSSRCSAGSRCWRCPPCRSSRPAWTIPRWARRPW